LMVYNSTNGQPINNTNCARMLIATDAKQTGPQGYNGAIDFGNSDASASTGAAEYNWRLASIMSEAGGDTSPSIGDGDLQFWTKPSSGSLTRRMQILANGIVDIYSAYTNAVGGSTRDLYVRNDGRLGYNSSVRASKTNIVNLTDISWLDNLEPKSFNMRKKSDSGEYTDNHYVELEYGLIAEDVESVNKELCSYSSDNILESVHYRKLIVPLLKAVQDQKKKIETLEGRISALEGS